jgi:hypothetical protein
MENSSGESPTVEPSVAESGDVEMVESVVVEEYVLVGSQVKSQNRPGFCFEAK